MHLISIVDNLSQAFTARHFSKSLKIGDKIVSKALTPLSRYWSDRFRTGQLSAGGVRRVEK
jgi:hypothetical protein